MNSNFGWEYSIQSREEDVRNGQFKNERQCQNGKNGNPED